MTMLEFILSFLASLIAGVVFSVLALVIFDPIQLHEKIYKIFPYLRARSIVYVNARTKVQALFKEIFIDFTPSKPGTILLMSNTGGLPHYDPFPRILELSSSRKCRIVVGITSAAFNQWIENNREMGQLLLSAGVEIYVFQDLTPYEYRIGVNTEIGTAFLCVFRGQIENRVHIDGFVTYSSGMLRAVESLFHALISKGHRVDDSYLASLYSH